MVTHLSFLSSFVAVYHPHTTDGIIISRSPVGEASVWCWILTRELGLIGAHAQGTRNLSSKLRPHVQTLTYGSFSFVRGKQAWKLVGARKYINLYTLNPDIAPLFSRILSLAKILIAGEEYHPEVFDILEQACMYVKENTLEKYHYGSLERLMVLRMLYQLGYIGEGALRDSYGTGTVITREYLEETYTYRDDLITLINASLKETQF